MSERPKFTLERTFHASPEEIWELWTTKEGIEAWMGPDGFSIAVSVLDVRPGGALVYEMSAVGAEQMEFMTKAGLPLVSQQKAKFVEVDRPRRLVFRDLADFVPGVEPYEIETVVELHPVADGTRMVLTFDAMHDDHWTEMARRGREMEVEHIAKLLAARE